MILLKLFFLQKQSIVPIRTYITKVLQRLQDVCANLEFHAPLVPVPSVEHSEQGATETCLHDLHAAHLCVSVRT